MSYSIPISALNELTIITSDDFFPIVDSGSLTTFRTPVDSFRIYIAESGSVISASWASSSLSSSYALSASWADRAGSASWADNCRSASYARSASWADRAGSASYTLSASWADRAGSASWADHAGSASWADRAGSASWADNAGSASYARSSSFSDSASWAPSPPVPASEVPIGAIWLWANQTPPTGWLICDGRILAQAGVYNNLYTAISTGNTNSSFGRACNTTGGFTGTLDHFKIPNMKSVFPKGWDGTANHFGNLASTGGTTSANHNHTYSDWAAGIGGNGGVLLYPRYTDQSSLTVPNGIPPSLVLNFIIRYA